MNLDEFREKNPAYADTPDDKLADGLYSKYYEGKVPREKFNEMIGYKAEPFDLQKMAAQNRSDVMGNVKALGRGVVRGAEGIAGLPGDVERLVGEGVKYVGGKIGLKPPTGPDHPELRELGITEALPSSEDIDKQREKVTGKFDEPSTTTQKYAESVGEFLPYIAQPEAAVFKKGARNAITGLTTNPIAATSRDALATRVGGAVAGGIGAEAGGEAAEDSGYEGLARVAGGALGGGIAGKVEKSLANKETKAALLDGEKIKAASKAGYDVLQNNPATIHPGAVRNFHLVMDTAFNSRWFSEVTAPATYRTMRDFEHARSRWTIGDVMGQYERLGKIKAGPTISAEDAEAARLLRSEMLDWLDTNVQGVKPQIKEALGNWSMHKKIEELQEVLERAVTRAASTGTGSNIDNVLRQEVGAIIKNAGRIRGYPKEVIDQLREVANGTILRNAARWGGRFAPTGLHSSMFTLALAIHSAPHAIAGAGAALASKKLGDFLTHRGIEEAIVSLEEYAPANAGAAARRQNVMSRVGGLPAQGAARGAVAGAQEQEQPPFMVDSQGGAYDALGNAQP